MSKLKDGSVRKTDQNEKLVGLTSFVGFSLIF